MLFQREGKIKTEQNSKQENGGSVWLQLRLFERQETDAEHLIPNIQQRCRQAVKRCMNMCLSLYIYTLYIRIELGAISSDLGSVRYHSMISVAFNGLTK